LLGRVHLACHLIVVTLLAAVAGAADVPLLQDEARRLLGADQGAFVRAADGTILAALNADRPMHPASVTKIATTLALLRRLGPSHRFVTRVVTAGPLRDGTVAGDLVVEGGGDPFFVTENALLVLSELEAGGLRTVAGALRIRGPFLFNWQADEQGKRLAKVFAGKEPASAWSAVCAARPDAATPGERPKGLRFLGRAENGVGADSGLTVTHRSPALVLLLKSLNCYSNNVFHLLSDRIGGPDAVEEAARASLPAALHAAVTIDDAAGLGKTNRLSPRAAVEIIDALAADLARQELTLAHVLPVAGRDPGTLRNRLAGDAVVGKTGTIGSLKVSALAGRARTRRFGDVTFALIDHGIPVPEAHRRQDAFVRIILSRGEALHWSAGGALASLAESEIEMAR
jgi:D-alanyl-D-alanine carboxypeptidase/D-alanyl-D-alanine-endopeptidase (penicillin-binding protein 4)